MYRQSAVLVQCSESQQILLYYSTQFSTFIALALLTLDLVSNAMACVSLDEFLRCLQNHPPLLQLRAALQNAHQLKHNLFQLTHLCK